MCALWMQSALSVALNIMREICVANDALVREPMNMNNKYPLLLFSFFWNYATT